ncbi:MAG: hypothetical protein CVU78_06005 [Elusimicrobia bacterium HGW-Elusimicrobia-2]|nr:MAG: hypothetical protein CVU78_06005 [Elusimicrobia bacterium HGW-Elusimicrobia-2]
MLPFCLDVKGQGLGFKEVGRQFIVVFKRKKTAENIVRKRVAENVPPRLVEKLVEGLVENQKKIFELMKGRPHISKRELSDEIGISATAIDKNIMVLKEKKLLKRVGSDKGGHWKVGKDVRWK